MMIPATASEPAEWDGIADEALDRLRTYLRFATVNDPLGTSQGDEREAAQWLAGLLRAEGITSELIEAAPGRASLVASIGPAGARSVTLLSHSDVVPAVAADWTAPPFAAEIRDGVLYGRGVLDLKSLGIAQLTTLIRLHRSGRPLRRQVRLIVAADEESGGAAGAAWLVRNRPELRDTDLVLGEGAYSPTGVLPGGEALHAVAVAEKGYLELELVVTGSAQHAGFTGSDTAANRLAAALGRVVTDRPAVKVTEPVRAVCRELSNSARGLHRMLLRSPRLIERIGPYALHLNPLVQAMLTETVAVTMLQAGYKTNVAPGQARAVLSIRLLPSTTADEATARIAKLVADDGVLIRRVAEKPPNESPTATADFRALTAAISGGRTVPILSPGASDARHWRAAGVPAYGWIPFELPVGDIHRVHGTDERLSVRSFRDGVRRYHDTITALVGK